MTCLTAWDRYAIRWFAHRGRKDPGSNGWKSPSAEQDQESKRMEKKTCALTDEDFGRRESNHCVCYRYLMALLQSLIN